MNNWPTQKNCVEFYGNPLDSKFSENMIRVEIPWSCKTSWDGKPYRTIQIHKKCSESLARILQAIWEAAGKSQAKIEEWGMDKCGGSWVVRPMRSGKATSMHSYGCAIDFDPARNGFGNPNPNFAKCPAVLKAFKDEGWIWGGDWNKRDGMHFQAAIVR